jgi:hypothetical protein
LPSNIPSTPPIDDRIPANETFDFLMDDMQGDRHCEWVANCEEGYERPKLSGMENGVLMEGRCGRVVEDASHVVTM